MRKILSGVVAFVVVSVLAAAPSFGSTVINRGPSNEVDLIPLPGQPEDYVSIMDHVYGSGHYQRVEDPADNTWYTNDGLASAAAKYAGNTEKLSFVVGATSTMLINVTGGNGYAGSLSGTLSNPTPDGPTSFTWELNSPAGSTTFWSSDASANPGGRDHMVTFRITQLFDTQSEQYVDVSGVYAIGWEDLDMGDQDYNDLVVEVKDCYPSSEGPGLVPEPASLLIWSLIAGLGGVGAVWRRKRA
jgi:hypothetical protein